MEMETTKGKIGRIGASAGSAAFLGGLVACLGSGLYEGFTGGEALGPEVLYEGGASLAGLLLASGSMEMQGETRAANETAFYGMFAVPVYATFLNAAGFGLGALGKYLIG